MLSLLWLALASHPGICDDPGGPPSPLLSWELPVQWRLSGRRSWWDFRRTWGGRWIARWDERNGTPRFLFAPGVPLDQDEGLVADVARLAGVDPDELGLAEARRRFDGQRYREVRRWTRTWRGAPVLGDEVSVWAVDDRIGGIRVALTPIHSHETPEAGEWVLPLPLWGDRGEAGPAWGVEPILVRPVEGRAAFLGDTEEGHDVAFFDRQGRVVWRWERRLFSNVSVSHSLRTIGDDHVSDPAR